MQYSATQANAMTSNNAYISTIKTINADIQQALEHNFYSCSSRMTGGSAYDVAHVIDALTQAGYDVVVSKENRNEWNLLIKWDKPSSEEGSVVFQDFYANYRNDISKLEKELQHFNPKKQVVE